MEHSREEVCENKIAGVCGALLFALGGGLVYFLLYQIGYISAISGVVGIVLYALFFKKESTFGAVTAMIVTLMVIAAA